MISSKTDLAPWQYFSSFINKVVTALDFSHANPCLPLVGTFRNLFWNSILLLALIFGPFVLAAIQGCPS